MKLSRRATLRQAQGRAERRRGPRREARGAARGVRGSLLLLAGAAMLLSTGCRYDMQNEPKSIPLRESMFFSDGSSARPLVQDTVARGALRDDEAFYTGKVDGKEVDTLPFPLTKDVLDRGQQRFNIYCTPCHDMEGTGNGMIVRRGYKQPPSYHIDRLRSAPIGHFYDVMTNGFGAMPDYRAQVMPRDRWAIAAYIRALQLSRHATMADVPADQQQKLQQAAAGQTGGRR